MFLLSHFFIISNSTVIFKYVCTDGGTILIGNTQRCGSAYIATDECGMACDLVSPQIKIQKRRGNKRKPQEYFSLRKYGNYIRKLRKSLEV